MEPSLPAPHLARRFGLLQATALNMCNMVGVGPFITIPLLLGALGGPLSMLGWAVAFLVTLCDGMVWSELGAMLPGSGGSYAYLRDGFGRHGFGQLMAFLFIWQFIFSGPMEIASGYIGFSNYLRYLWPDVSWLRNPATSQVVLVCVAATVGLLNILLLYRRITSLARLTVVLWVGTLLTMAVVIVTGVWHFNPKVAFQLPAEEFHFSWGFLLGLGMASRIGVYDYLGYYDVCYIGEEVKDPGRVIPRSILISLAVIAVLYVFLNLSVIGVVPWQEFVPASDNNPISKYVVSVFMERVYGRGVAAIFTLLILWTAVASVFALLLGYSRIPYAAAQDGNFFKIFGRLHPTGQFPHVSLLVIGGLAIVCCAFSLDVVIEALVTTRILIQFIGQIVAVAVLRWKAPAAERPYRIWLYPLPSLVALAGWLFIFVTAGTKVILFAVAVILAGVIFFLVWSRATRRWPFGSRPSPSLAPGTR
jgi:amino acid transporter